MNLVYAFADLCKGACVLGALQNVDKSFELLRGVSRRESFPEDARFDMSIDFGIKLQDVLRNAEKLLVVSERLKERLENDDAKNVEFMPVVIHDKKGRRIKERYFIAHTTVLQGCLDLSKTIGVRNPINPDLFIDVDAIGVDATRIDPDVKVFRPKHYPFMLIMRRELADSLVAGGFTGIAFGEIDVYDQFETL